jgi:hypothetical protein
MHIAGKAILRVERIETPMRNCREMDAPVRKERLETAELSRDAKRPGCSRSEGVFLRGMMIPRSQAATLRQSSPFPPKPRVAHSERSAPGAKDDKDHVAMHRCTRFAFALPMRAKRFNPRPRADDSRKPENQSNNAPHVEEFE